MAIHLAPGEVVAQITETGVADSAGVERGKMSGSEGSQEVAGPQVDVEGSES